MKLFSTFKGNKVPKLTKFLYPFSGIFRDACYALVGSFLLQFAMNSGVLNSDPEIFKAQYGVITIAMMIALVWDGINDPIMGFIVEKVHFKLGKFKPWILIGAIGNAIAVALMFAIHPGDPVTEGASYGWAFVVLMIIFYFLWDLFFTMNDIGYWSMLPSLTNDESERATLTSRVTIAASIGGFLMTAACFLLPSMKLFGMSYTETYGVLAVGIALLFLASQVVVFLFCQEKERDAEQEKTSEESSLLDLFKVFIQDKTLRFTIIAIFLYYVACGVLTGGIGLNFFYIALGYGSAKGGLVSTIVSIMYVLGNVGAQALYPKLAKKISKKKILTFSFILQMVCYGLFIVLCLPIFSDTPIANNGVREAITSLDMDFSFAIGGSMFIYYVLPLLFFFAQGLMYMAILIMFQNAIDNHEYIYKERKESLISSWRPLDVKLGSALLRGFQWLIFTVAGAYGIVSGISTLEGDYNANHDSNAFISGLNNLMNSVTSQMVNIIGILMILFIAAAITGAYLCCQFGYKISDEEHAKIVSELENRHKAAGSKAA